MPSDEERSAEQLLDLAEAAGHEVSRPQLARWHRADLLPRPRQAALGKGQGTVSLYPAGTGAQLLRLCRIHLGEGEKRLTRVAWRLWWEGYPIPPGTVRAQLQLVARELENGLAGLRGLLAEARCDEGEGGELDRLLEDAADTRTVNRAVRHVRKRAGKASFPTVLRILLEVAIGSFEGYFVDWSGAGDEDEAPLVERALGFSGPPPGGAWESGAALAQLGGLLREHLPGQVLAGATDEELGQAREEIRRFLAVVAAAAAIGRQTGGPGARALRELGELLERPREQALLLLVWLSLGHAPQLHRGTRAILTMEREAQAALRAFTYLQELRQAVPALAELLAPKKVGAAQRSPQRMARLHAQVRATAEAHRKEVEAFVQAHPGVREFLDPSDHLRPEPKDGR